MYDLRSSCYVGAAAISVPYQLYNDECEPVPGPEGKLVHVSTYALILANAVCCTTKHRT